MKKLDFQLKTQYPDYLSSHKLHEHRRGTATTLIMFLLGLISIYSGVKDPELDLLMIIAGGFFLLYSILLRPMIFNAKIRRLWNRQKPDLRSEHYFFDSRGIRVQHAKGNVQMPWADFKKYKKNNRVLNLYFTKSKNWLIIPLHNLEEEARAFLLRLIEENVTRTPIKS